MFENLQMEQLAETLNEFMERYVGQECDHINTDIAVSNSSLNNTLI